MTVETVITDAQTRANETIDDAKAALTDASNMVQAIGYVIPNYQPVSLPSLPGIPAVPAAPALQEVEYLLPSEPSDIPVFQDISPIEAGAAPQFTAVAPTFTLPTTPAQLVAFNDVAPTVETVAFPDPPSMLVNPTFPELVIADRLEPSKPQTSLPAFDVLAPTDNTVAPTDHEQRFEAAYREAAPSTVTMLEGYVDAMLVKYNPRYHEQMAKIETQLATYMEGGTALNPAIEIAIYDRARGKNDAEARRVRDAAYADAAARGFTLPTGAVLSAVQSARQAAADNNSRAANEIAIAQANMEQQNLQFAVTTSMTLRTTMLQAALSYHQNLITINGQAIDYAKTVLSAIIEVYNTSVKVFQIKLEAYRAEAAVYETRLKSAMAGIELYQAEVKALEALTNVDRAKVDVYKARIDSLTALSNVYRAQIDAVTGRVSLEKLKLEVFQTKVQAYSAQVQAKNSEYQGYTAQIEGQTAQARSFASQADAFSAQVTGYRVSVDAQAEVVRATATTNQARAEQYKALLAGYSSVASARGEVARTRIENQRQSILSYQASNQAIIANAQVYADYYRATSTVAVENARLNLSAQIQTAESTRAFGQSIAQLGTSSAQVYSSLASAAMSGINTLSSELKYE